MSACEHCWSNSGWPFDDYATVLRRAEAEGAECTKDTLDGRRLRAGQWWDEATQSDVRDRMRLRVGQSEIEPSHPSV